MNGHGSVHSFPWNLELLILVVTSQAVRSWKQLEIRFGVPLVIHSFVCSGSIRDGILV